MIYEIMTLEEFIDIENNNQEKAAELIGVTQSAISQAIANGREIYVQQYSKNRFGGYEFKPFGSMRARHEKRKPK